MQENSKEYAEYKSFDELPKELKKKFKSGTSGTNLKKAKDGYLGFINLLNKRGDELAGDYINATIKTQVRFGKCGHTTNITPTNYKKDRGCGVCRGLQVQRGVNDIATTHPHLVKYFVNKGEAYAVGSRSNKKVMVKCRSCNNEKYLRVIDLSRRGFNCEQCACLAITHPHLLKYFSNKKEAYVYSYGSGKKIRLICPICGEERNCKIQDFVRRGFSCNRCGDGVSYGEKFMIGLLEQLNLKYTRQHSYDKGKHKYDFLIGDTIIEIHGEQHYIQQRRKSSRSLEEEQENDMFKYDLAVLNGHEYNKNYFVIDARTSTYEWMKKSIMSSKMPLFFLFEEDDIDWKKIHEKCQSSIVREVCDYFANNNVTTTEMQSIFKLSVSTLIRYLKTGAELGWCDYKPEKHRGFLKDTRQVKGIDLKTGEEIAFLSLSEAAKYLGDIRKLRNISSCCRGERKSAYGYVWSYIDDTEETNSQNQTNQNT